MGWTEQLNTENDYWGALPKNDFWVPKNDFWGALPKNDFWGASCEQSLKTLKLAGGGLDNPNLAEGAGAAQGPQTGRAWQGHEGTS